MTTTKQITRRNTIRAQLVQRFMAHVAALRTQEQIFLDHKAKRDQYDAEGTIHRWWNEFAPIMIDYCNANIQARRARAELLDYLSQPAIMQVVKHEKNAAKVCLLKTQQNKKERQVRQ